MNWLANPRRHHHHRRVGMELVARHKPAVMILRTLLWLYRHVNMFPGLMPWLDDWAEEQR